MQESKNQVKMSLKVQQTTINHTRSLSNNDSELDNGIKDDKNWNIKAKKEI